MVFAGVQSRGITLLSPAGDWECVRAAVANGADAVYFGLEAFNARMRAENFSAEDLPEVMNFLHAHGVRGYVTLNVLIFPGELEAAVRELQLLERCGVDAVIIQDVGLALLAAEVAPRLRVHASTQMTITSPEGVAFARQLGVRQVVLARECSLRELAKFSTELPLEMFVHGALCVAYSGQCLTSEALGQRSANRGECAQACRMPYELIVDGKAVDLGDKKYLLSPQDLAAVEDLPSLLRAGVTTFKIEGRLKSPEYVAAVTSVYRRAIDRAVEEISASGDADGNQTQAGSPAVSAEDWYRLEMTFSRGLFPGWIHGVDHQKLVPARFGKKRGPFAGKVAACGHDWAEIDGELALHPGDGVVFDTGGDTNREQGGRILRVQGRRCFFRAGKISFAQVPKGALVWKTDDPRLSSELRKTWAGRITARSENKQALAVKIRGKAGEALELSTIDCEGNAVVVRSGELLVEAKTQPLTTEKIQTQLAKLEETPFVLASLQNDIDGEVHLSIRALNQLRRDLVAALESLPGETPTAIPAEAILASRLDQVRLVSEGGAEEAGLHLLVRDDAQLHAAVDFPLRSVILDFEDLRRFADAVAWWKGRSRVPVFLATPRIQKSGEEGFFKLILRAGADGVVIRNVGGIQFFQGREVRSVGDFSLNVANPLSAGVFLNFGLERVTASYDLNIEQLLQLARGLPAGRLEVTLHQHMPMFHMEHCVFAAFMSNGRDYTDCGRPCEKHRVHLRDRVGVEHPLRADVGCRNTLYQSAAQTAAAYFSELCRAGVRDFRVELLEESTEEARTIVGAYVDLLRGTTDGASLWRMLRAKNQLGVTKGTLVV